MRVLLRSSIRSAVTAIDEISFELFAGEIVAVVGPNGAGKSTLFRILTGLTTPTSGKASVGGFDVVHHAHHVRKIVGFSPAQEHTLLLRNTCAENLQFHGRLHGLSGRTLSERIDEVLEFVGLSAARDRVGFALSSGMKARLQLARAMLHRPQVLILDEPTATVDPLAAYEMLHSLQVLARQGTAILISSHRLEEIEALHDRVLLLDNGRVRYQGNLDELRAMWQRPHLRISFIDHEAARRATEDIVGLPGIEEIETRGSDVIVATAIPPGALLGSLDGRLDTVTEVQRETISLMDLLVRLLNRESP